MPDTKKKYTENTDKVIGEGFDPTANVDAVGGFNYDAWNDGGSGVGSKSNIEKLASDYVNSNYDSFTQGDDYASLAKRYGQQGQQAMKDTLGQISARTGGLASSYATQAAQQSYNGYMEKLEDAARSLYDSQMAEKANKLGVAQGLYDAAYNEWQDGRDFAYGKWQQDVSNAQWKDTVGYGEYQDRIDNAQWADSQEMQADEDAGDTAKNAQKIQNLLAVGTSIDDIDTSLIESSGYDKNYWNLYAAALAPEEKGFVKANFLRNTESGNYVFEIGEKEVELAPGINPYTYSKNPDVKHGTFSNGYQPNNVGGDKLTDAQYDGELYVNGVKQKVWTTEDGQWYYWDGTQNKYIETTKEELDKMSNGE